MHRLLIVDHNDVFVMAVNHVLGADFEITSCQDGETALEMLSSFQPQVLIINLSLPYKDGLTVLQQTPYRPPVIIAVSNFISPFVEKACLAVNVSYLMTSPCLNALRVQTLSMVQQWEFDRTKPDLPAQAKFLLHTLNFPTHRVGYRQLCKAIVMYYKDRDQCLDTVLYAELARMFQKSSGQTVERAMRSVIEQAWQKRESLVWQKYFPYDRSVPSNKVFLDVMANHLHE